MSAVRRSSLPAPLPSSPMAGATNPNIISGMINERKLPKMSLNVAKTCANHMGLNCPTATPRTMAMAMRPRSGILDIFIMSVLNECIKINL